TRRRDDGRDRRGLTMWPFSRWRRSRDRRPARPPARCLRCGEMAQPGYVTADGASTTILGWNVGEPTIWRTRDVVLDRRVWFGKPARWPAHRCEACGLVMFQFFVEERWRGSPAARPSHNPRRDDVADRRGGVTGALAGPRLPGVRPRHAGDARGRAPDVTPGPGWRTAPPLLATAAGGYAGPQSEGGCDVLRRSRRCRPVPRRCWPRPPVGLRGLRRTEAALVFVDRADAGRWLAARREAPWVRTARRLAVPAGAAVAGALLLPRARARHALRRLARLLRRRARYVLGRLQGVRYRLSGRHPDPDVPDTVLGDRIRSTLGPLEKRLDVPRVHVMVEDHVALLHGEVGAEAEAED